MIKKLLLALSILMMALLTACGSKTTPGEEEALTSEGQTLTEERCPLIVSGDVLMLAPNAGIWVVRENVTSERTLLITAHPGQNREVSQNYDELLQRNPRPQIIDFGTLSWAEKVKNYLF